MNLVVYPFVFAGILFVITGMLSQPCLAGSRQVNVREVEFRTPMTVIAPDELEVVRERIAAGREPQATAYRRLLRDADRAMTFTPDPPERMRVMGGYQRNSNLNEVRAVMERESTAAYATALAWLYSGEAHYAEKSAEILEAWTKAGTRFTGMDRGLQLGSWFNGMLYGADILKGYDGWSTAQAVAFEEWWRTEVLPHVQLLSWRRENNWKEAGVLGVLTAAVVFEDRQLLEAGLLELDLLFQPRRRQLRNRPHGWRGPAGSVREPASVPGRGKNWKFHRDERGVYLPHEVTRSGGLRGVTYTGYALTSLVQAMEIARYTGHDWWQREAANGVMLQEAIGAYFRWNELKEDFPWNPDPRRDRFRKNSFEIVNNHFPGQIEGLEAWLQQNRPVEGRQGDPYVTLNRGDLGPLR